MRYLVSLFIVAVAGCASEKKKETPSQMKLDEETQKLVAMHNDIWNMMGLSENAKKELNEFVLKVNKGIQENRYHNPNYKEPTEKRDPKWQEQTHDDYVKKHKERFTKLKISEATQNQLFAAMDFVWKALHDPNVPEKDKETAKKIKEMMKQLPKCCDDSIFDRATPH